ncbi:hypothetical protein CDAR_399291 [Caerostris darwini]|uniref:Uncharacterized protein n=1 Tax=Caerostris darwini TaxID=1538125 RepID=A0AAV4SVG4_9ARAC|nr:hypothetical protein CDAR_399291 [Caerostris darwini]
MKLRVLSAPKQMISWKFLICSSQISRWRTSIREEITFSSVPVKKSYRSSEKASFLQLTVTTARTEIASQQPLSCDQDIRSCWNRSCKPNFHHLGVFFCQR